MAEDRDRLRTTFDGAALLYDELRPGYPEQLFDDVVSLSGIPSGGRVLEVGCGTGQATLPFARRGYEVLCVELGENLAAVARRNLAPYPKAEVATRRGAGRPRHAVGPGADPRHGVRRRRIACSRSRRSLAIAPLWKPTSDFRTQRRGAKQQDPDAPPTQAPLLDALLRLFCAHRPVFRQERPFRRMQALLFGYLFSFARRTVTQALVSLRLTDHDWSAFYRLFSGPRIDHAELTRCYFRETLPHVAETDPYVAVVDGVQVPRHSHRMPDTSRLKSPRTPPFMPGPHRAQRFLHLAALLPQSGEGYTRALPLR